MQLGWISIYAGWGGANLKILSTIRVHLYDIL